MSQSQLPSPQTPRPDVYAALCPSREILSLIGEKWTALIVGALEQKVMRFGELKRVCDGISQKMLTQTLRRLERDGLVTRTLYADVLPVKTEYRLTELGRSLLPVVRAAKDWAEANLFQIQHNRAAYNQNHKQ
ncbi:MAG: helix-turn-helix domain-containing protein [Cyanobacteria bacterium J06648_16]